MKILFRVSGGKARKKELGLGHIYRSKNLASQFKKNQINFLLEDYGGAKKILSKENYNKKFSLTKNSSLKEDIEVTSKIIKNNNIDVLIIDKYLVKKRYVSKMKEMVKTVVISDLNNIDYDSNLLVNGFVGFKNKITMNKFDARCLLGPKFQIIDKRFSKKISNTKKKYDFLITFGGFDERNINKSILEILSKIELRDKKIKMILGPASSKKIKVPTKIKNNIFVQNSTQNMFNEMNESKFGICSGGMTTYEFAALKIPFAVICQNKHQIITAKKWEKQYGAINLGMPDRHLARKIERLLAHKLPNNTKKLVDGLGSIRIKKEIENLVRKH